MIMLVDMSEAKAELSVIAQECAELGKQIGMSIYLQHEDIFNAMHTI
jgi:ACT domain-containing protein